MGKNGSRRANEDTSFFIRSQQVLSPPERRFALKRRRSADATAQVKPRIRSSVMLQWNPFQVPH